MNVRRLRMSFRRHVAPALAIFASCVGCTRTTEARIDEHLALQEHAAQKLDEHETETRQTGPETITTTTEEYEDGDLGIDPGAAGGVAGSDAAIGVPVVAGRPASPVAPRLVRRTVVVDQRGPIVDTKAREVQETGSEDVGLDMTYEGSTTTKTSYWPPWWVFVGGTAVLALASWAAYKFTPLGKLVAMVRAAI